MRITDSTVVALPDLVEAEAGGLADAVAAHTYRLNDSGAFALEVLLSDRATVGVAAERVAARFGIPRATAHDDVVRLVCALNDRALVDTWTPLDARARCLRFLRSPVEQAGRALVDVLAFEPLAYRAVRRRAGVRTVVGAVLPTLAVFGVLGLAVTAVLLAVVTLAGAQASPSALWAATSPEWVTLVLVATIVAHEVGHLVALPDGARARAVVVRRGLGVSVAHPTLHGAVARRVALAGPLAALAVALLAAALVAAAPVPDVFVGLAVALGLAHLWALAPWQHDGRMLVARPAGVAP